MFFIKSSKNPIDPSYFLDAFSRFMVSMERGDFVVNSQQDVPGVLNYIFDSFCGISVLGQDQIRVVIRKRITCTNCLQSYDREDIHMIVKLNVAENVNTAFDNFGTNKLFWIVNVLFSCPNTIPLWKREWWLLESILSFT